MELRFDHRRVRAGRSTDAGGSLRWHPVSSYAVALPWYERLFGASPTFFTIETEAVWELVEHRWTYLEERPEHAGHAMRTIFVDDLDDLVERVAQRGLDPARRETYPNAVRKVKYRDPHGNEVGYGDRSEST